MMMTTRRINELRQLYRDGQAVGDKLADVFHRKDNGRNSMRIALAGGSAPRGFDRLATAWPARAARELLTLAQHHELPELRHAVEAAEHETA